MRLTILHEDDTYDMEASADSPAQELMVLLEGVTGIPIPEQAVIHNGKQLNPRTSLTGSGVQVGDLLEVIRLGPAARPAPALAPTAPQGGASIPRSATEMSRIPAQQLMDALRERPANLAQLPPQIQEAVLTGNVKVLEDFIRGAAQHEAAEAEDARIEAELAAADPMDPTVQARIAERIRLKNVEENRQRAFDEAPEIFFQVPMLYVKMEVNKTPILAFVDSGAQMSNMSKECAERCNILHLLDSRFAGMAVGVGTTKILGKVHALPMKVGNEYLQLSVSVLEDFKMDFLFGLDMLRRYRCSIDLAKNALCFPEMDVSLPFLQENEIPSNLFSHAGEAAAEESQKGAQTLGGGAAAGPSVSPAEGAAAAAQARAAASGPIIPTPPSVQGVPAVPPQASGGIPGPGNASGGAPGVQGGTGGEDKVAKLMALGFPRAECEQALAVTGGNEDMAAALLFGMT